MANTPAAVYVNGTWAGTHAGGTSADVYLGRFGQPPFIVTVDTPNDLVVAQLEITAADVEAGADVAGSMWGRADLPCGTIRLSYGKPAEPLPQVGVARVARLLSGRRPQPCGHCRKSSQFIARSS